MVSKCGAPSLSLTPVTRNGIRSRHCPSIIPHRMMWNLDYKRVTYLSISGLTSGSLHSTSRFFIIKSHTEFAISIHYLALIANPDTKFAHIPPCNPQWQATHPRWQAMRTPRLFPRSGPRMARASGTRKPACSAAHTRGSPNPSTTASRAGCKPFYVPVVPSQLYLTNRVKSDVHIYYFQNNPERTPNLLTELRW